MIDHPLTPSPGLSRRQFGLGASASLATLAMPPLATPAVAQTSYTGPNVILVRFGGGVRRQETIDPARSVSPYLLNVLAPQGTLFTDMRMAAGKSVVSSHGQGTLYILTGRYDRYADIRGEAFRARFEPKAPTLFEYLRRTYAVPVHQTLIVNGEDRIDEEFYAFSAHHMFGAQYRSEVLSLYRYKRWLYRARLAGPNLSKAATADLRKKLTELEAKDYRRASARGQNPDLAKFWQQWRRTYGDSGLVNPRGDRLLTELAVQAIDQLKPRLMMINYQDPDYVHWGIASHYTRGISIIDQGLRRLVAAVNRRPDYRGNTVFVIVPDCGRDSNPLMPIPYQHHFNSSAARQIWALMLGPGIAKGRRVTTPTGQDSIAATIGQIMKMPTVSTQGPVLKQAFA